MSDDLEDFIELLVEIIWPIEAEYGHNRKSMKIRHAIL
jgi:hypothetical protein